MLLRCMICVIIILLVLRDCILAARDLIQCVELNALIPLSASLSDRRFHQRSTDDVVLYVLIGAELQPHRNSDSDAIPASYTSGIRHDTDGNEQRGIRVAWGPIVLQGPY